MLLWMRARERAVSPLWALLNTFTPYKEKPKTNFKTIYRVYLILKGLDGHF